MAVGVGGNVTAVGVGGNVMDVGVGGNSTGVAVASRNVQPIATAMLSVSIASK
jgi:hypothetical protein